MSSWSPNKKMGISRNVAAKAKLPTKEEGMCQRCAAKCGKVATVIVRVRDMPAEESIRIWIGREDRRWCSSEASFV